MNDTFKNLPENLQDVLRAAAILMLRNGMRELVLSKDEDENVDFSITYDTLPEGSYLQ